MDGLKETSQLQSYQDAKQAEKKSILTGQMLRAIIMDTVLLH